MNEIYTSKASIRNPFHLQTLPFAAKVYRLRKGKHKKLSLGQKLLKAIIPGRPFLAWLLKYFSFGHKGVFQYKIGEDEMGKKPIQFNIGNTQFHSIYFPQYQRSYEPETTVLIDRILSQNPHGVFYDIGANWGHMSLHAASLQGFHGSIHSFEPFPSTYNDLSQVVEQSGKGNVIQTHHMAVSDFDGTCTIGLPDNFNSGNAEVSLEESGKGFKVTAQKVDSMNFEKPTLMKVDVDGFEINVLKGAEEIIKEHHPMIIFENWADLNKVRETLAPFKFLKNLGYRFFEPSFLIGDEKAEDSYFAGYSHVQELMETEKDLSFSLVEFVPEQRFLLSKQLNVFACHKDSQVPV